MKQINAITGLAVGIYLVLVVINGNQTKLADFLKNQADFARWAVALMILFYIRDETKSAIVTAVIFMALIAMGINAAGSDNISNLAQQFNKIFNPTE